MTIEAVRRAPPIDIPRILEQVPRYTEFMTGDELVQSSWQLLEKHSDMVANGTLGYEMLGKSTDGRNIELLRVGKGKRKMLWVGTPHPNEPIGTLASEFLSSYLCDHPEILEEMDATVLFIKNADPDGLELNTSWLKEDMDPLKYALGFYRPPRDEQVEFGFPIDYKTLFFDNPTKESAAVIRAMHKYNPGFLYSLHNTAMHPAFYYLNPKIEELLVPLQENILAYDLPLAGEMGEVPYGETWASGIFEDVSAKQRYEYLKKTLGGDPAEYIVGGSGMGEYLETVHPHALTLTSEVPYFTADALYDDSPSEMSLRDAIIEGSKSCNAIHEYAEAQLASLGDIPDSRLKRGAEGYLKIITDSRNAAAEDAMDPKYDRTATVAESFLVNQSECYYGVLAVGQVYQLAVQAGEFNKAEELKSYMSGVIDSINAVSQLRAVPIQTLVRAQVGAGLLAMQHAA